MRAFIHHKTWAKLAALSMLGMLIAPANVRVANADIQQFTTASLELSNSRPEEGSDWIIEFDTAQEIPPDGSIVITPEDAEFTIPVGTDEDDLDLTIDAGEIALAAAAGSGASSAWGVSVTTGTSGSITLTNNDTDTVAADATLVIEIGTNATQGATGDSQIANPAKDAATGTADIWEVDITSYEADGTTEIDTIDLLVAIIDDVTLSSSQAAQMSFVITGETAPDAGEIAPNYIRWNELTPGVAKTAVQRVKVNTSAFNGFTVYIRQNNNMQLASDNGIDIDAWSGTNNAPTTWASPAGTSIGVNTGYLGYHTSDGSLNAVGDGADRFGAGEYAGLTASSEEVLYHDAASQSDVDGQDYADITFQIEVNNLQPSGNYSNEIIYIAKPIF
jgi:hypothetical protein